MPLCRRCEVETNAILNRLVDEKVTVARASGVALRWIIKHGGDNGCDTEGIVCVPMKYLKLIVDGARKRRGKKA